MNLNLVRKFMIFRRGKDEAGCCCYYYYFNVMRQVVFVGECGDAECVVRQCVW